MVCRFANAVFADQTLDHIAEIEALFDLTASRLAHLSAVRVLEEAKKGAGEFLRVLWGDEDASTESKNDDESST